MLNYKFDLLQKNVSNVHIIIAIQFFYISYNFSKNYLCSLEINHTFNGKIFPQKNMTSKFYFLYCKNLELFLAKSLV